MKKHSYCFNIKSSSFLSVAEYCAHCSITKNSMKQQFAASAQDKRKQLHTKITFNKSSYPSDNSFKVYETAYV
jgi:hypothetical protein